MSKMKASDDRPLLWMFGIAAAFMWGEALIFLVATVTR
jgi:hypothetical protein